MESRSFTYIINKTGPSTDPRRTLLVTCTQSYFFDDDGLTFWRSWWWHPQFYFWEWILILILINSYPKLFFLMSYHRVANKYSILLICKFKFLFRPRRMASHRYVAIGICQSGVSTNARWHTVELLFMFVCYHHAHAVSWSYSWLHLKCFHRVYF